MKTRNAAVLLVAIVVLAGCTGGASQVATTETTDDGVTTAEATTGEGVETTTDVQTADLPPGVNDSGVENTSRLLEANREALAESGYAFRLIRDDTDESEYDQRTVSHGTVAKEFAPFRIRTENEIRYGNQTSRAETDAWGNESVALAEYTELNRTSYQKYVEEPNGSVEVDPFEMTSIHGLSGQLSHEYAVGFALQTGEYEVESVERRDGRTLTTLRATEVNRSFDEREIEQVSHYDATLVVDERGRIHQTNLTIEFPESTFSYDFELTEVGGVVVAYPSWADRALATENATEAVTTNAKSTTTATESATATTPTE